MYGMFSTNCAKKTIYAGENATLTITFGTFSYNTKYYCFSWLKDIWQTNKVRGIYLTAALIYTVD